MKKIKWMHYLIKPKSIAITLMLLFSFTSSYAGNYGPVLEAAEKRFDESDDKAGIILKPIATAAARPNKDGNYELTEDYFYTAYPDSGENFLVLAVKDGDDRLFEKFLEIVTDPDDPALLIRGRERTYNLVNLVCDCTSFHNPVPLKTKLKMLDALAEKKFNFNYIDENDPDKRTPFIAAMLLTNRPFFCVERKDDHLKFDEMRLELAARLLLHGADVQQVRIKDDTGAAVAIPEEIIHGLVEIAFNQVLVDSDLYKMINPTPYVKELLGKRKEDHLRKVHEFSF